MNRHRGQPTTGGSPGWEFGMGLKLLTVKNKVIMKHLTELLAST
jgi:hypothetical protein